MWTAATIRARPDNDAGEYSMAVSPDGTRHLCWVDNTDWRVVKYSAQAPGGAWSEPTVAVLGEYYPLDVPERFDCYHCKMDVADDGTPIFLFYAEVAGRVDGSDYRICEMRLQVGLLGTQTVLYHWDGGDDGPNQCFAEAISAKRGALNYWYTVAENPLNARKNELYENDVKVHEWAEPALQQWEVWCDNGPGGYVALYRDESTWTTNFGATLPTDLTYASATMAQDGRVHVAGLVLPNYYPTYYVYEDGVLTQTSTLETVMGGSRVYVSGDAAGNVWIAWSDYSAGVPRAVRAANPLGLYIYDGALTVTEDYFLRGACAYGGNRVAWGGLNLALDAQVWIELRARTFSAWTIH